MREIKFRAWVNKEDTYGKKGGMYTGFSFSDIENGRAESNVFCEDRTWEEPKWDKAILMQFTGLLDKSGKEIYEGDIVIMSPGFGCEWEERVGIVKYEYSSFWVSSKGRSNILDDHDAFFEIIGNKWENPELLGGGGDK